VLVHGFDQNFARLVPQPLRDVEAGLFERVGDLLGELGF
jgi:hypothetical protein